MRIATYVALAIFLTALNLPSAPRATASFPAQAGATIDLNAVQLTVDTNSLPEQPTSDPF